MKNSKYVKDWCILENNHGIYTLAFTTTERGVPFESLNDEEFLIGYSNNENEIDYEILQEVPQFLVDSIKSNYIQSSLQNKDEILFFYIPIEHIMHGEIIFKK